MKVGTVPTYLKQFLSFVKKLLYIYTFNPSIGSAAVYGHSAEEPGSFPGARGRPDLDRPPGGPPGPGSQRSPFR